MTLKKSTLSYLSSIGIQQKFIDLFELIGKNFINSTKPKEITEPTLVFSDIHGNYPSLLIALNYSEQNNVTNVISLGDLIEYNHQNNEVLSLIQSKQGQFISQIKGNHDDGQLRDNGFFITTYFSKKVDKKYADFILNLPKLDLIQVQDKKILLCHSNPWTNDSIYLFPTYFDLFQYFFNYLDCDGFFFGHTHHLTFYTLNNKFAFNPGSLGVSRDGNPRLTFSWLYPDSNKLEIYEIRHNLNEFTVLDDSEPRLINTYQIPL